MECQNILEQIDEQNDGAEFYRADLHIHTFGSSPCVKDSNMNIDNLIDRAKAENIKILAVSNHNGSVSVSEAITKACDNGILVIPATELSTPQGHLLVYFEHIDDLNKFISSLSIIKEANGETRCNTGMYDCLEALNSYERSFAILAHIDSPKGLLQNADTINQPLAKDILKHKKILGFEIKNKTSEVSFNELDQDTKRKNIAKERIENLNIGKNQFLAKVMFSDAHTLEGFGKNAEGNKRLTRIKLDELTFCSLRHAMIENDSRIRIEDEIPENVAFIYGAKYVGGLLDGQQIKFSKNLNCIIGGRGTGKSTIFDTVRCLDKNPFESERKDCEIWPETIDYIWQDELKNKEFLSRPKNSPMYNINPDNSTSFYIETFGQGDTAKITADIDKDPSNLISFLDKFINFENLKNEEFAKIDELTTNKSSIFALDNLIKPLQSVPMQLKEVEKKLKTVSDQKLQEIIQLEQELKNEAQVRKNVIDNINILLSINIPDSIAQASSALTLQKSKGIKHGNLELKSILSYSASINEEITKSMLTLSTGLKKYIEPITLSLKTWQEKEAILQKSISEKKEIAIKAGIQDLNNISRLIAQDADLKKQLFQLNTYNENVKKLKLEREQLLLELATIRNKICDKRNEYASNITAKLKNCLNDLTISLKYNNNSYSPEAENVIKREMSWRTNQTRKAWILIYELTLPTLIKVIKNDNIEAIENIRFNDNQIFTRNDAKEIILKLKSENILFFLEEQLVFDTPRVTIAKNIEDASKPIVKVFSQMSLGQQQSVLLSFVLASENNCPLIIDQPEDNLDGEFIYQSLIPSLRQAKERRQVIIVTHNSNIAVLGDAELIIPLRATSKKTIIKERGSIDRIETNKMTCDILEGAIEAFRKRALIYGFNLPNEN